MWLRLVAAVLVVVPSPKAHNRLVMVPVELSVKETVSGHEPMVGAPTKSAAGTSAPAPRIALVELPPSPLNTTTLLKLAALVGVKRTTRLVEANPAKLKGTVPVWPPPDTMLKGPPLIVATPLVSAAPPRLVTAKLAWALAPTTKVPKFRLDGEMASCGGVRPLPETALVELPPLLVKTTTLLKLVALVGAKLTMTKPV